MKRTIAKLLADKSGATSIEYGVVAVLIAIVILVALNTISIRVAHIYALIGATP